MPRTLLAEGLALLGRDVVERVDVVFGEVQLAERRHHGGERLRRPALLARHPADRHRPFFDRPDRLTGDPVEHVEEAGLAGQRHHVAARAVLHDGRQLRGGAGVEVPQVVVHELEVPDPLAGAGVERQEARAVQVRARAIGAVVVVGRRPGREIGDAAGDVHRQLAPGVDRADVLVGVGRPGVVAELARLRDGVEAPHLLAGEDVEGAHVSGRRHVALAGRRAQQEQVLEHLSRRLRLDARNRRRVASEAFTQVDGALVAEGGDELAGAGVDRLQVVLHGEEQPAVRPVGALPVVDATRVMPSMPSRTQISLPVLASRATSAPLRPRPKIMPRAIIGVDTVSLNG